MTRAWLAIAVLAVLAAAPWYASATLIQFGINALLLATLAQAWNIIGGYTGYASFGNSVFYGLGSYGTAVAMATYHLPFAAGLAIGVAVAVLFALVIGVPVLRLRGHYFAIATLGLSQVMTYVVANLEITGRNIGIVMPLARNEALFYELSLALLAAATLCIVWISRSRFGFGLISIRENEDAAAVMGVDTRFYKVAAFMLAGAFTAVAGGIHAYWITFVDPESAFDISLNVKMIIMAVFGGAGSVFGPVVGAFVLSGISEALASKVSTLAALFFGLVIILAVLFMPHGLADLLARYKRLGFGYFAENIRRSRL